MSTHSDVFNARTSLEGVTGAITYYRLDALRERDTNLDHLPFTVKIILENALRHAGSELVSEKDVLALPGVQFASASTSFSLTSSLKRRARAGELDAGERESVRG